MKYRVTLQIPVTLEILVDAEDEDEAIDEAMQYATLSCYAGNGGPDKLVGTSDQNVSIHPGDSPLEGSHDFEIVAELQQ